MCCQAGKIVRGWRGYYIKTKLSILIGCGSDFETLGVNNYRNFM